MQDVLGQYAALKERFGGTTLAELESGGWMADFVKGVLATCVEQVDAAYLERVYGSFDARDVSPKIVRAAARRASIAAALSATVVTAAEASAILTGMLDAPLAAPAMVASIAADVAYTTLVQLRATYELSVLHGAPLSVEDVEDCYLVLMSALAIEMGDLGASGDRLSDVGDKKVALSHARRVVLKQGRKIVAAAAKKHAGRQVARKMTERTLLRVLVPGISIPISAALSWRSTKKALAFADRQMRRRAAIVRPLVRAFDASSELSRDLVVRVLATLMAAPLRGVWSEGQLDAMRHTRGVLSLERDASTDGEVDAKDGATTIDTIVRELSALPADTRAALADYLVAAAAVDDAAAHDDAYALVLEPIARVSGRPFDVATVARVRAALA